MKNIAVLILLWILIREKMIFEIFFYLILYCVCVPLCLYMIRNLYDLIKFYIENMWLDSRSLKEKS